MLSINTNLSSIIAQRSMKQSTNKLNQAIERMTTGAKINHAKDNAANYNIATNMTTKLGALQVAEDNCAMGLDLLATAEGSLNTISDKLSRLRALAVQSQNGTYGGKSLEAINQEAESIVAEIKREYSTTEYNGLKLFNVEKEEEPIDPDAEKQAQIQANIQAAAEKGLTRVSEAGSVVSGQTYAVCDVTDLHAIPAGASNSGVTFELMGDIDLEGETFNGINGFQGKFKGNGHIIKNYKSSSSFFGDISGGSVDSVGLVDCEVISSGDHVGSFSKLLLNYARITNCYASGTVQGKDYVGGLVAMANFDTTISNSYSLVDVSGNEIVGGIIGWEQGSTIRNSYATGNVSGSSCVGGLIGYTNSAKIYQSFFTGTTTGTSFVGGIIGKLSSEDVFDTYYDTAGSLKPYGTSSTIKNDKTLQEILDPVNLETLGYTEANGWVIKDGMPRLAWEFPPQTGGGGEEGGVNLDGANVVSFQVGVNSGASSGMSFDLAFSLVEIDDVMGLGLTDSGCLSLLDSMIFRVSGKAIEYGAMQNRLISALDEITVQRDNLISSRSTLRDADIAEVSSTYIKQQILQQASATLLATANQSPSIALQLI